LQPHDIDNAPTDEIGLLILTLCCLTTGDRDVALEEEVKPAIDGDYFHNGMK